MSLKALSLHYEHYETPVWAAEAILEKEILTKYVFDPCCGSGVLSEAAKRMGYQVTAADIHDWGYEPMIPEMDFLLADNIMSGDFTVFMNPPFSKAVEFVEKCFAIDAKKIVCFQRFAWWESKERKTFWEQYPPNRVYICGNRADCWRHDLPVNKDGRRLDPETGRILSSSPTAHAWFVWERDSRQGRSYRIFIRAASEMSYKELLQLDKEYTDLVSELNNINQTLGKTKKGNPTRQLLIKQKNLAEDKVRQAKSRKLQIMAERKMLQETSRNSDAVSDHATIRYLERKHGINIRRLKQIIYDEVMPHKIPEKNEIYVGKLVYYFKGNVLVTIMKNDEME